jgi:ACS family hexuronate transporter-like MFS transporter
MGGFALQLAAGWLKEATGTYVVMFAIAGSAYLVALAEIELLIPRVEPARL